MAKITGKYEVLYIIDPAQGEEGIAALVEKFKAIRIFALFADNLVDSVGGCNCRCYLL